jgi:hypothetical protein
MENILAAGRARRLVSGAVLGVVTLVTIAALVGAAARPPWFTLVFLLAWLSALSLLQARDRT